MVRSVLVAKSVTKPFSFVFSPESECESSNGGSLARDISSSCRTSTKRANRRRKLVLRPVNVNWYSHLTLLQELMPSLSTISLDK